MSKSLLVRIFGFPATLIHGDTLILDRWLWLQERLPETCRGESLIDIGCGSGAFTIGAALKGYSAQGLTWNERERRVACERAKLCSADNARFEVFDVRNLDQRRELAASFDVAICFENIEHIIDDRKLLVDIAACLKPGGRLFLTTPNLFFLPISPSDNGPYSLVEDGNHVRRGYSEGMLEALCGHADLIPQKISYCSGFLSQKITAIMRFLSRIHPLIGWAVIVPLRIMPPLFDPMITKWLRWPFFSICLEAVKPGLPAE